MPERAQNHTKTELLPKVLPKMFYSVQFNHIKCLVPNCPGAKLSWCQIVHFYYLGAKLSSFIILVPNCLLYYLGAKLFGAKLSGAKLSGAKLSYNQFYNFGKLEEREPRSSR